MECHEQSAAAEQWNRREQDARENIATPEWIGLKMQIGHVSHAADAKERPQQQRGRNEQGTVEERFEMAPGQKRKKTMRRKPFSAPKKKWSKERPDKNRHGEIGRQFSYGFQRC